MNRDDARAVQSPRDLTDCAWDSESERLGLPPSCFDNAHSHRAAPSLG